MPTFAKHVRSRSWPVRLLTLLGMLAAPAVSLGQPPSPPVVPPTTQPTLVQPTLVQPTVVQPPPEAILGAGDIDGVPEPVWEFFFRAGAVIPLGGDPEDHLRTGWTFQLGLREPLAMPRPSLILFHEFAGSYTANPGDNAPIDIPGFFQGLNPPDDHIHFVRGGVLVAGTLPPTPDQVGPFWTTRLRELQRLGVHYALGATWAAGTFDGVASGRTFFMVRTGIRGGYVNPEYHKIQEPLIVEGIREHFGHNHRNILISSDGGRDSGGFFGLFQSLGAGLTLRDATWIGRFPGDITLAAELEFSHEWISLGDYSRGRGVSTFMPMLTVNFAW